MSAILIYSNRCKHCNNVIKFIQSNPEFGSMLKYHDVNTKGIPPQFKDKITSVPTLITTSGKFMVGGEVKTWLESLLPNDVETMDLYSDISMGSLDNPDASGGGFFELEAYGRSLQPALTPELEERISADVKSSYQQIDR